MDKLVSAENMLADEEKPTDRLSSADFIVTTGRGRKKKAHIPKSDGSESLCGHSGRKCKPVDSETVEKFYSVCSICDRLS